MLNWRPLGLRWGDKRGFVPGEEPECLPCAQPELANPGLGSVTPEALNGICRFRERQESAQNMLLAPKEAIPALPWGHG